jgi:hypothetical protein
MKVWIAALVGLVGQALAGGVETWPSRDVDLGRIYTAPDGWSAMVLVSRVHAYPDRVEDWFAPRVAALAGRDVTASTAAIERLPGGALRQRVTLTASGILPADVIVTAYATQAGNQMLVEMGQSDGATAYVADHVARQDVWTGEVWAQAEPLPPVDVTGLECRMEQQPSVVWVIDSVCKVDCADMCQESCRLEPTSAMTLIDAEVCREPR